MANSINDERNQIPLLHDDHPHSPAITFTSYSEKPNIPIFLKIVIYQSYLSDPCQPHPHLTSYHPASSFLSIKQTEFTPLITSRTAPTSISSSTPTPKSSTSKGAMSSPNHAATSKFTAMNLSKVSTPLVLQWLKRISKTKAFYVTSNKF